MTVFAAEDLSTVDHVTVVLIAFFGRRFLLVACRLYFYWLRLVWHHDQRLRRSIVQFDHLGLVECAELFSAALGADQGYGRRILDLDRLGGGQLGNLYG